VPTWCADMNRLAYQASLEKGVGNSLICMPKIHPAMLWKMTSSPMKTTTMLNSGAWCSGRITANSTTAPSTKDTATVAKNATQYGTPAWIMVQARKVENIAISPCAKFTW
jgi:hypothetical protein